MRQPLALLALLTACPGPQMPTGPSPEYEDPPPPSWLDAGVAPAPPPTGETTGETRIDPAPALEDAESARDAGDPRQ